MFMNAFGNILTAIISFFIAVGNGARTLMRAFFYVFNKTYNILSGVTVEIAHALSHWLKEKLTAILTAYRMRRRMPPRGHRMITVTVDFIRFRPHLAQIVSTAFVVRSRIRRLAQSAMPALSSLKLPRLPVIQFVSAVRIRMQRIRRAVKNKISRIPLLPRKYRIYPPPLIPLAIADRIKWFFLGVIVTTLLIFIPYVTYLWLVMLPSPNLLSSRSIEVTTKIFDRNGVLLYEIYADQNRTPLPLSEIPEQVKQATVAIEDRDFYRHPGVSLRGIARAVRETVINRRIQGGSTITQQLIKTALLTPEVTLHRKINEIFLAFWAEQLYTKDQILEMYLNQVPYGGTAWGIEAAAHTYFGKSVRDVTLAEAALLAGLPAAPSFYSPFGSDPKKALDRQAEVLRRMAEDGYISESERDQALSQEIRFAPRNIAIIAPHFVMYVRTLLEERYGPRVVDRGGLRIVTSMDSALQEKVESIVATHISALTNLRVGNGAVLVTNPKTGEILAMAGSKDYFNMAEDGNVNVTTSLRQPGSSIKIVNYAAALENGFTAATILEDSPITFSIPGSPAYTPVNYDGTFHGSVPLRYALGNSYNVPAVKVLSKIGVSAMIAKGKQMGITTWDDEGRFGLSLTLGGGDVRMTDLAVAFGTLANNGGRADLLPILEVTDYTGRVLERNVPFTPQPAVRPEVAWILSNILSDNVARSAAFGPNSALVIPGKTVSVKTGTSNDKRDNWTVGYTPSYLVAAWVGNNNNAPMHPTLTSGVTGAAPLWHDIMAEILKDKPDEVPPRPDGVVEVSCYYNRVEYFIRGTEPAGGHCGVLPTSAPTPSPVVLNSATLEPTPQPTPPPTGEPPPRDPEPRTNGRNRNPRRR